MPAVIRGDLSGRGGGGPPPGAAPASDGARESRRWHREPRAPGGMAAPKRKTSWRARLRRDRALLLMTLPAVALLAVFGYAPMLGLVMAFQDYDLYDGFLHSPWVGLANFQQLFADPGFWHAFANTLVLFSVQLVLFFPVPIALAILLDSLLSRRLRSFVQSVVTLPHFFSFVMIVTIFNEMLGGTGLLNTFLRSHGVKNPPNIMTDPSTFKFLVSGQLIWKEAGWSMIVFLAALAGVIVFVIMRLIAPAFFKNFPVALKPILDSGIILTTIVAVILNAYYNGLGSTEAVEGQLAEAARAADH